MPRYKWTGPNPVSIPDANGVTVSPGEEFDGPANLDHPYIVLVGATPDVAKRPPDSGGITLPDASTGPED